MTSEIHHFVGKSMRNAKRDCVRTTFWKTCKECADEDRSCSTFIGLSDHAIHFLSLLNQVLIGYADVFDIIGLSDHGILLLSLFSRVFIGHADVNSFSSCLVTAGQGDQSGAVTCRFVA